jgi:hypothetical protein
VGLVCGAPRVAPCSALVRTRAHAGTGSGSMHVCSCASHCPPARTLLGVACRPATGG